MNNSLEQLQGIKEHNMSQDIGARLDRLESEVALLKDREAIRDVIYKYCRAVDRADTELLKSCYWPDGFDDHGFYGGNAMEFAEHVTPLLSKTIATTHAISNPIIDVQGDVASAESQVDVLHRVMTEDGKMVNEWCQCRYLDSFEKREGQWRIKVRVVVGDGIFWMKMDAALFMSRDFMSAGEALAPSGRYPDDSVYRLNNVKDIAKVREVKADIWSGLYEIGRKL